MNYNRQDMWVVDLVSWGRGLTGSAHLSGVVVLGWISVITTGVVFTTNWGELSTSFIVGQLLVMVMVTLGPWDVWYYSERLFPTFFDRITDIAESGQEDQLKAIADRYEQIFSNRYLMTVVPWTALVVLVFFVSHPYRASLGITGPYTLDNIAYFCFFVYWAFFSGMGFHGGVVTILCIREIAETITFDIDPLHPDSLGGLSSVGYFAIRTTVLISTGSLAVPLSLDIASSVGIGAPVYLGVGAFMVMLAGVFVYPTVKINRRAQELRADILEDYRQRLRGLQRQIEQVEADPSTDMDDNVALRLEIERVRREFKDYRDVKLYPLSYSVISQLVSSILLPLIVTVIKILLFP